MADKDESPRRSQFSAADPGTGEAVQFSVVEEPDAPVASGESSPGGTGEVATKRSLRLSLSSKPGDTPAFRPLGDLKGVKPEALAPLSGPGVSFAPPPPSGIMTKQAKEAKEAERLKLEKARKRVGFAGGNIFTRMLGFGDQKKNARGHSLMPAATADMAGYLYKQGFKIGAWQKRYFVLHGALLAYYDEEANAQGEPDETKLHGVSYVEEATRWGAEKPAQIPDNIYREHRSRGFKVVTEDREFMLYSDSEAITAKWVDLLSAAAELAHKTRDRAESAAVAAGATDAEMPPQPELDTQLAEMLDAQGYKEQAKVNIMQLTDSHKWQLIKSYQQSLVDKAGDIRSQPEHWINILTSSRRRRTCKSSLCYCARARSRGSVSSSSFTASRRSATCSRCSRSGPSRSRTTSSSWTRCCAACARS